jgi:hypothetical protein
MSRRTDVRFGSFAGHTGTAVHAEGWWFIVASQVALDAPGPAVPLRGWSAPSDDASLAQILGVAFQVTRFSMPLPLVALRTETTPSGSIDVIYPLLLQRAGPFHLGTVFSSLGPSSQLRTDIAAAIVSRLLPAAG